MKKLIISAFLLLTTLSAHAGISLVFNGAPPNMAACLPFYEDKFTVLASYSAYYDLTDLDPRIYELKAFDSADHEIPMDNVKFEMPGIPAVENSFDLSQYAGHGAFSFQAYFKGKIACKYNKIDVTQIHIKAVPTEK